MDNEILELFKEEEMGWDGLPFYGKETRAMLLTGEVDESKARMHCAQLFELEREDDSLPVFLHFNTVGGSVFDAFAIYDTMTTIKCPVVVNVRGLCASAGLLLLAGGDYRYATASSMFFYHQVQMHHVSFTSKEHIDSTHDLYTMMNQHYAAEIRKRCNISEETWASEFGNKYEKWFQAEDALEWGLINGIIQPRKKTEIELDLDNVYGKERTGSED